MTDWEADVFGAEMGGAPSVDLHGMDRFEAVRAVEQFLDQEFMSGSRVVEIVHGRGTGVLRDVVHECLRKNVLVEHFCDSLTPHQMSGVTYAVLARK